MVLHSKWSAGSIRFFLFADVRADLLQLELELDRGHGISTSPEMLAREVPFFAALSGHRNGALPFREPNHRGDRMLRGNRNAIMHVVRHRLPFENQAFFLPGQRLENLPPLAACLSEQHHASSLEREHRVKSAQSCSFAVGIIWPRLWMGFE